jgi:hypothetical protein
MRLLQLALVFIVSLFLFSCNETPNRGGTVLSGQVLLDEVAGLAIDTVPDGSFISFSGTTSKDSLWIEVHFNGKTGWIRKGTVALDCSPAYLIQNTYLWLEPSGDESAGLLDRATIVAVGQTIGERTQIFYQWDDTQLAEAWILADDLAYDLDARFASLQEETYAQEVDYGESDIMVIPANLAGAPEEFLNGLRTRFRITPDVVTNEITFALDFAEQEIANFFSTIIADPNGSSMAWQYLSAFVAQVPDFVDIGPHTDYVQYSDENFRTTPQSMRAFLMMRIDRSPENIQKLYDTFGDFIKYQLTMHDVSPQIREYIEIYDHIVSMPNARRKCTDVLNNIKRWDREHANSEGIIDGGFILAEQRELFAPILDEKTANEEKYETQRLSRYSFWLRRFAEGNEQVVYNIFKDLSAASEPSSEVKTITCTFQAYEIGDCGHMMFDCGDYGEADISKLSEEDKALWLDLGLADSDGESEGDNSNPKYVGKSFTMKVGETRGPACNDGQGGEGRIPLLLEFGLVE